MDDHRGEPLTDAEVKATRCEQLQALQRKAFSMEALQDFALANLAAVDTPTALKSHFGRLQLSQLARRSLAARDAAVMLRGRCESVSARSRAVR